MSATSHPPPPVPTMNRKVWVTHRTRARSMTRRTLESYPWRNTQGMYWGRPGETTGGGAPAGSRCNSGSFLVGKARPSRQERDVAEFPRHTHTYTHTHTHTHTHMRIQRRRKLALIVLLSRRSCGQFRRHGTIDTSPNKGKENLSHLTSFWFTTERSPQVDPLVAVTVSAIQSWKVSEWLQASCTTLGSLN
ncbi:hypothetical protein LZ32DRAFT_190064 [Colletotrichum eremochloae]|nr:hypothetical protein LZ32DRAFT_190064 [Colletotrichum eremochloae]